MKMKNLIITASVISGAILTSQSAFGQAYGPVYQSYPNDLVMGFQNQAGGGTQDYIINLGPATNIIGQATVVDLSGDFSRTDFNAVLGSSSSMYGGVLGAQNSSTATAYIYATQLRSGGAGTPSTPGSDLTGEYMDRSDINKVFSDISTLFTPAEGTGGLDTGKTWESLIDPPVNETTGQEAPFYQDSGVEPDAAVSTNTVLYEDLWTASSSKNSQENPWTYVGYFTLDLTGANPKLTFTSTNVPGSLMTKPIIVSISKTGSTVTVVSSNAVPPFNYQLQYTASLNPTNWINVGSSVVAASMMVTNTDPTAPGANRFYRVQGH